MKYDIFAIAILLSLLTSLATAEDCPEYYTEEECRHYEPYLGYNSDGSINPPRE